MVDAESEVITTLYSLSGRRGVNFQVFTNNYRQIISV